MDISIIGAGNMARGISARLVTGGHHVVLYSRDGDQKTYGNPLTGEVVVLAVPYSAVASVISDYRQELEGKIIIDITNPVNFESFTLIPPPDSSGAEEIAKLVSSNTQVIKAFNTTFAGTLLQGKVDQKMLDVFVAGDNQTAKSTVMQLITDGGLRPIDVGKLSRARHLESMQLIHMVIQQTLGTNWMSTIKILN